MLYLLGDNLEPVGCKGILFKSTRTTWSYGVCQSLRDSRTEQYARLERFQDLFTVPLSRLPFIKVFSWDISRGLRQRVLSSLA